MTLEAEQLAGAAHKSAAVGSSDRSRLLSVRGLKVGFGQSAKMSRPVVHGVDLDVAPGEIHGIVGESGSGKSVTCLALMGLAGPNSAVTGRAYFDGEDLLTCGPRRIAHLRGSSIGMIFQDPMSSLNPVMTIGRQISEAIRLNDPQLWAQGKPIVRAAVCGLLTEVGLSEPDRRLTQYPHELSGGMNQRVMIAMMLAGNPRLLIADEPTTALDATIQAQILRLLIRLRKERGMAILIITHDLGVIAQMCDRVSVMYAGRVIEEASTRDLFNRPRHPYTSALLRSRQSYETDAVTEPAESTAGHPKPGLSSGCAYRLHCPHIGPNCIDVIPALEDGRDGAACHYPLEAPQ